MDKAWARASDGINRLGNDRGAYSIRNRARQVDGVYYNLVGALGVEGQRNRVVVPYSGDR